MSHGSQHCPHCDKQVLTIQGGVPGLAHLIHLAISVLSAGLWLIIWIAHVFLVSRTERCSQCGTDIGEALHKAKAAEGFSMGIFSPKYWSR